jgi:solute:Na+ symporter, SSS family
MLLKPIDWGIIIAYFVMMLIIGLWASKKAGKSSSDFFLSGRTMPWWLLGFSMVATTFSTDTPNLVTDIVRQGGVSGNWAWWAFLLTGMLTVFIYSKLWRRSNVMTDVEFYEIRYSGKTAAFLRGFRALYLGVFFNIMIMAMVSLAAIKIGGIMLNLTPLQSILIASVVTAIYSALGGLFGVLLTDFVQFIIAMAGAIVAAVVAVHHPAVGNLHNLFSHPDVMHRLNIFPAFDMSTKQSAELLLSVFIIPIAVQWWSVWYPGAEPGGGGYMVQRMLAAKNERHATSATLFFNVMHYALRPWPWIIVALCSIIVFPDLQSIHHAFPHVAQNIVRNDLAYPAMLSFLPVGIMGIVIASLIAAYMSTISTHLNWGSSYVVNDFYKRFMKPDAPEKELVMVGRISIFLMMAGAAVVALILNNALQGFQILLQIGAGTGLLFILRWFWWRINAACEITAMVVSFFVACYFQFFHIKLFPAMPLESWQTLCIGVAVTTCSWIITAILTKPTEDKKMRDFCRLVNPGGPGWKKVIEDAQKDNDPIVSEHKASNLPLGILCMFIGTIAVYSALFAAGFWLYSNIVPAVVLSVVAAASGIFLVVFWDKANAN